MPKKNLSKGIVLIVTNRILSFVVGCCFLYSKWLASACSPQARQTARAR